MFPRKKRLQVWGDGIICGKIQEETDEAIIDKVTKANSKLCMIEDVEAIYTTESERNRSGGQL
jgi:hypothetical protein